MRGALVFSLILLASATGCSLLKNADDIVVGDGVVDSTSTDTADASDADAPNDDVTDASDAPLVEDRRWALWPMPSPTPSAYDTTATDIVVDEITGLRWQEAVSPTKQNAAGAAAACKALTLGGLSGWRLPTRVELVSLLAFSPGASPAINAGKFPGTPAAKHWTASDTVRGVYVVDFAKGDVTFSLDTALLDFRCVHSP
jgi:hypothetical protein